MKYKIYTLGCKVNNYESEYMKSLLDNEGFLYSESEADIVVINTCTVTNNSDRKSRKMIRAFRRENENAIIVAVGCFCQNVKGEVDADIVLGNKEKSKIVEYINEFLKTREKIVKIYDMNESDFEDMEIKRYETHTRAFVKVEDGCNNFCSYCIIPYVRGRVRSKGKDRVINEVKSLVQSGHKEIVLTGIHTGQYNDNGYELKDLICDLVKIDGLYRLRLSSIEVVEVNEEIIELLKNNKVFVSHLHIPLQSGSDKVLRLMNRRYSTFDFYEKISKIRSVRPEVNITTDLIVGFNGEEEEDFLDSYNFCEKVGFSKIHVFPFSLRNGTKAEKIDGSVSAIVKRERVKKMISLSNRLEYEYYSKFFGRKMEVLIEEVKDGCSYGYTENYIRVRVYGVLETNKFYEVVLNRDNVVF